jgi:hypothetical protein
MARLSNSAVREATARGVLKKVGRGRWALKRNGSAYCDHMRKLQMVGPKGQGHCGPRQSVEAADGKPRNSWARQSAFTALPKITRRVS